MDLKEKIAFAVWRKVGAAGRGLDDAAAAYVWPQVRKEGDYYNAIAGAALDVFAPVMPHASKAHVDITILMRAEFELTHSQRTGDVDDKIVPDLRAIIEDHLAGRGAAAPEAETAAPADAAAPDPIIPLIIPPAPISLEWKCAVIGIGIGALIAVHIIWRLL